MIGALACLPLAFAQCRLTLLGQQNNGYSCSESSTEACPSSSSVTFPGGTATGLNDFLHVYGGMYVSNEYVVGRMSAAPGLLPGGTVLDYVADCSRGGCDPDGKGCSTNCLVNTYRVDCASASPPPTPSPTPSPSSAPRWDLGWPMWGYDSQHSRRHRLHAWNGSALGARTLWQYNAGVDTLAASTPVFADGATLSFSRILGTLRSCKLSVVSSEGKGLDAFIPFFCDGYGGPSSPAIFGGSRLGFGTTDDFSVGGSPYLFNGVYRSLVNDVGAVYSPPVVDSDVGIVYGVSSSSNSSVIFGVDPRNLTTDVFINTDVPKWSYRVATNLPTFGAPVLGVFGDHLAVVLGEGRLHLLAKELLVPLGEGPIDISPQSWYTSSPAVSTDGNTVYVTSGSNVLVAVGFKPADASTTYAWTTQTKWTYQLGDYDPRAYAPGVTSSSPGVASDGTIIVGGSLGGVYAVWPNGTLRWVFSTGSSPVYSSPALSADGTVFIGCNDGNLYVLAGSTGALVWSVQTGKAVQTSPSIGAINGTTTSFIAANQALSAIASCTAGSDCICGPGAFNDGSGCVLCSPGSYAPGVGAVGGCTACPAGTYSSKRGQRGLASCLPCPPGMTSAQTGAAACTPCLPGTYMPNSGSLAASCFPCAAGSASAANAADSINTCRVCPPGYFSGTGNADCTPCSPGSFNPNAGGNSSLACLPCPTGSAGALSGASSIDKCVKCAAGYFAASSGLTSCSACPPGTFNNRTGAASASDCARCPKGTLNPLPAGSSQSAACGPAAPGTYVDTLGSTSSIPCPAGTFRTAAGATSASDCARCPMGFFGNSTGASACTACPRGYFSSAIGATTIDKCIACPAGTFNPIPGSSSSTACIPASPGFYVDAPGSTSSIPCPFGSYRTAAGATSASDCALCPPGYYGDSTGAAACTACPRGYFSSAIGAVSLGTCSVTLPGQYADITGLKAPIACPAGTFSDAPGSIACKPCALGFYAGDTGRSSCTACPSGTTTYAAGAYQCVAGYYTCPAKMQPIDSTKAPTGPGDCGNVTCELPLVLTQDQTGCTTTCGPGTALSSDGTCARCAAGDGVCLGALASPYSSDASSWSDHLSAAGVSTVTQLGRRLQQAGATCDDCSVAMALDILTHADNNASSGTILYAQAGAKTALGVPSWAVAVAIAVGFGAVSSVLWVAASFCSGRSRRSFVSAYTDRLLKSVDMFGARQSGRIDGSPMIFQRTRLGGSCS